MLKLCCVRGWAAAGAVGLAALLAGGWARAGGCSDWRNDTPSSGGPSARQFAAMAYDSVRGVCLVMGGVDNIGTTELSDSYRWDGREWRSVSGGPAVRFGHAMAFDVSRSRVVMFGGIDNGVAKSDTWEWDGEVWSQVIPTGSVPSARLFHGMVYDSARRVTVLFGGINAATTPNAETWEWNGAAWTLRDTGGGPSVRSQQGMAYDSARGVTVLFGGTVGGLGNNETWEWDGNSWTQQGVVGPSARTQHAMAYDSARRRTVLYGGNVNAGGLSSETWEWDGSAWEQRTDGLSTGARWRHAMVYDARRDRVVLFGGGLNAGATRDLWEREELRPGVLRGPLAACAMAGGAAEFEVAPSCFIGVFVEWTKDGVLIDDGGNISGAQTPRLHIEPVTEADGGVYAALVSGACGQKESGGAALVVIPAKTPPNTCPWDFDGDGMVGSADLALVLGAWGVCP